MGQGANITFNAITVILVNSETRRGEQSAFSNTSVSLIHITKGDLVPHAKKYIALCHLRNIISKITSSTNFVFNV
jgi:hypothetical protein